MTLAARRKRKKLEWQMAAVRPGDLRCGIRASIVGDYEFPADWRANCAAIAVERSRQNALAVSRRNYDREFNIRGNHCKGGQSQELHQHTGAAARSQHVGSSRQTRGFSRRNSPVSFSSIASRPR